MRRKRTVVQTSTTLIKRGKLTDPYGPTGANLRPYFYPLGEKWKVQKQLNTESIQKSIEQMWSDPLLKEALIQTQIKTKCNCHECSAEIKADLWVSGLSTHTDLI